MRRWSSSNSACFKQTWSACSCACQFLAHYVAVSLAWSILFILWVWPPSFRSPHNCFLISGVIHFYYMTGQRGWKVIRMAYIPIRHLYCKANFYMTLFYHLYIASFIHDRNINRCIKMCQLFLTNLDFRLI